MYNKISDYGVIGNLRTVALVGPDGSIDWLCLPRIDSPSVFAALLDDTVGGRFTISPDGEWDSAATYVPGTNILVTTFRSPAGIMKLTDFMPIPGGTEEGDAPARLELYRLIEVTSGEVHVRTLFEPRFDYARAATSLQPAGPVIEATGGGERLILCSTGPDLEIGDGRAEGKWRMSAGDRVWLHLLYGWDQPMRVDPAVAAGLLEETRAYWVDWLQRTETGHEFDFGPFKPMMDRSALVLKLLCFDPTGAIAAAATTSLPEEIGGSRNWDYRYTWVRDTSLTLQALFNLGHLTEMEGYLRWMERVIFESGANLQIMYGIRGETDLPEEELPHFEGYKGSRPVRIGNAAASQKQLDIYGEIMDAALKLSNYAGKIDAELWPFLRSICDYVVDHWKDRDNGIWEVRGGPYHFVYSKVMCWVALDRGLTIARRYGFSAGLEKWERVGHGIKEEVLQKGWNAQKQAFVQHYETDALDASNLLIPIFGFLPYDDPRVVSTVDAIRKELRHNDFLYRYRSEDGLEGEEGTFLIWAFWLIDNLVSQGKEDEAVQLLYRIEGTAGPLGLFAEEYDVKWREALGNYPQAFSHIGYINSVVRLCRRKARAGRRRSDETISQTILKKLLVTEKFILNDGRSGGAASSNEIASELKKLMNVLRGAFFNTAEGRVAYEEMDGSTAYRDYVEASYGLKDVDPNVFTTRGERLAFWINLFNTLVIHGVIELGIRDSVKEAWRFFRRIEYRIGDMLFSADEIEHGILRGNHRFPNSPFRPFRRDDPRGKHILDTVDPRIHFALVCASSSCPPIEVYTADNINAELTLSGKTFLNAGGVRIDRDANRVSLSQVFRWYAGDFGATKAARLRFIAPYLYDDADRAFLEENAERARVSYQKYDWRLNR